MTTPESRKPCCPDRASVCSRSRHLFLDAVQRAGRTEADPGIKPRRCWLEIFKDEVRPEPRPAEPSDVVLLRSRRSRQASDEKLKCGCDITFRSEEMDRSLHEDICMRTLAWVVRVPYETQAGRKALADSIRMCRADAARLAHEYRQHKPKIVRVFPLYK